MSLWTIQSLAESLRNSYFGQEENASLELVGEPQILLITQPEYGDLKTQVALSGQQILVFSPLWQRSLAQNPSQMDEMALRLNPMNPLSNLGIMNLSNEDWYVVFGELSTSSTLEQIIEEIETLTDNTIEAIELFQPLLKTQE